MTIAAGDYYGLPAAAPAAVDPGSVAQPGQASAPQTAASAPKKGWHQSPVFVVVALVALAYVLAKFAEHGAGLGLVVKGSARA